ncbi:hypothetical protein EYB25_005352 [Talaromyces marneffei]|uniref:Uncharacterized protein n=1 Tax=Talaromyces marneffei PM1 TaxID=1077442 RepID=A0A093XCU1_TALMA|nr:uncharacterized protein EYB26_007354 [Talaromyces marneffei]KAE8551462.1 hypothetical protein EYB25_005352 [Talaromyces marneffei]QGA19665.1 hypothetical protein EYB26_007354 [Talaromyces marneffei]
MGKRTLHGKSEIDIEGFHIPRSVGELEALITKSKVASIHDLDEGYLGSGSLGEYGLSQVWAQAIKIVKNDSQLKAYLGLISSGVPVTKVAFGQNVYPGFFAAVKYAQDQIKDVRDRLSTTGRETRSISRMSTRKPLITFSNPFEQEVESHRVDMEYENNEMTEARAKKTPNTALVLLL